jgi:conjugative transposon TraN protein
MLKYFLPAFLLLVNGIVAIELQGQSFTFPPDIFQTDSPTPSINITFNKTSTIIFPFAISHVDRGSNAILVQKLKGTDNILKLKAATENFSQTNLTILTVDGKLFSFLVNYDSHPRQLVLYIHPPTKEPLDSLPTEKVDSVLFSEGVKDELTLPQLSAMALGTKSTTKGIKTRRFNMKARVSGILVKENHLFFRLLLQNRSHINYDIESIRFSVRDKRQARRTAIQELEKVPRVIVGNDKSVKGDSSQSIVFALDKFTIPDAKWLFVGIHEKEGGRHLSLKISNRKIIKAALLREK